MSQVTNSTVIKATDATFEKDVLGAKSPVLVDFWASWCGPCKMLAPVLEELSGEYTADKLTIAKLNVDENAETAQKYGITSIPTLLVFKNGQVSGRITGFMPKAALKTKVDALL